VDRLYRSDPPGQGEAAMEIFFLLMFGHFAMDYGLQTTFIAVEKSHLHGKDPDRPDVKPIAPWYQVLLAHSWLHAGAVYLVTHSLTLAIFELIAHWCIDYTKCSNKLTYNQDQALHFGCKLLWAIIFSLYPSI
jgi:hypothetical protein